MFVNLELCIRAGEGTACSASLTLNDPSTAAPAKLVSGASIRLDSELLHRAEPDTNEYGSLLAEMVFAHQEMREQWAKAVGYAQKDGSSLRLCLTLDACPDYVHAVRWELLREPLDQTALAINERVWLSRYVSSSHPLRMPCRVSEPLRVVAHVAHPSDLANYGFAPFDIEHEHQGLRTALRAATLTILDPHATLDDCMIAVQKRCDILYIVAHGAVRDGTGVLWFAGPNGRSKPVRSSELCAALAMLAQQPMLVVLATCQSAGDGASTFLPSLGAQLITAGIPAVIAMQGNISISTASTFMPVFFRELQTDGQIDRALTVARARVASHPDWWRPVLLTRLRDGRLWKAPTHTLDAPSLPTIDQREGVFISGGSQIGSTIGVNYGIVPISSNVFERDHLSVLYDAITIMRRQSEILLATELDGVVALLEAIRHAKETGDHVRMKAQRVELQTMVTRLKEWYPANSALWSLLAMV